VRQLPAR